MFWEPKSAFRGPKSFTKIYKFQGAETEVISVLKNARFTGVSAKS